MSTLITIPGKVFLIGEYSVLQGGRCLLAALKPGYGFEFGLDRGEAPHPESPLALYADESGNAFQFTQSTNSMRPGFGSSTAELIAGVIHDVERLPETKRIWSWYREKFPNTSGADLAVQMEAYRSKRSIFEFDRGEASSIMDASLAANIFLFQAPPSQKLKTHQALKEKIPSFAISRLNDLVSTVKLGFESGTIESLLALNTFADEIQELGLETSFAHPVRMAFRKREEVLAVKGCGAGLNDVFLVVANPRFPKEKCLKCFLAIAHEFSLTSMGTLQELLW